jgi:hypothetical protein
MSSNRRERSDYYEFQLSDRQLEAFLEIAAKKDRPLEEVILGALDKYIETEKQTCQQPKP